ncbi:MAG: PKD domain-containing protein [Bacteroidales bacterium]|nr:PKD domain-containing protein [Bacteroidales bacterium]
MSLNLGEKGFAFPNQLFLTPHISCKHDDCFRSFSFSYFSFSEGCGFLWDFGDNTEQSTETSPIHVYEKSGKYTVKLTVTFSSGETKTLEKNLVVNPPLEKPKIIVE